ncbi:MAG: hypothetical protein WCS89_01335 [Candidatus Paceibacterota bacterium]|jgi:cell division septal protein FtsQ
MRPHSRLTSYQSKKFIERKNARVTIEIALSIFCIALWLYCFSGLSYLNVFTIKDIRVNSANINISVPLQALAKDSLQGSYMGLFSKSNIFIYPHNKVVSSIEKVLPSVKSLTISRDGFQGLKIDVIEKNPSAIVCAGLPDFSDETFYLNETDDCYLADWSGYIFDKVSSSSLVYNRYFIPALSEIATSSDSVIGLYATSSLKFSLLQDFYNGARNAGIKVLAILVKDNGEYEMYANDTVVYFNGFRPLKDQLSNLISFWNRMVVTKNINMEYIDIRYGSNVFYREIK